jgi:hypothetical protein
MEKKPLQILTTSESGLWVLALPSPLRPHQQELELILAKVFAEKNNSPDNLALAQQLSLNWCVSMARKQGISLEETFR